MHKNIFILILLKWLKFLLLSDTCFAYIFCFIFKFRFSLVVNLLQLLSGICVVLPCSNFFCVFWEVRWWCLLLLSFRFQTPPIWPAAIYSIGSACLQILWYLIMIHLLEGFLKLVNSTNKGWATVRSHQVLVII